MANNRALVILNAGTVGNGATIFSTSYNGEYASGFRAVLIQLTVGSSVTVTEQASVDGTTFYDVVDGSGTALGAIATALTSSVGVYVQFNPIVARHNKLKIVAAAASTVTLTLVDSEQG